MNFAADHQRIEPIGRRNPQPRAVAQALLDGFNRHYALFRYGAQRAKSLFESGNWRGIQQLSQERIEYYDTRVHECTTQLTGALKGSEATPAGASALQSLTPAQLDFWQAVKGEFVGLLSGHR